MTTTGYRPYVTAETLQVLLDHTRNVEEQTAFRLGYFAGLRREEVFQLEWRDVDFAGKVVQVRRGKRSKARQVPLSTALEAYLQAIRGIQPKRVRVVQTKYATNISHWFRHAAEAAVAADKLDESTAKEMRFHSLRHGFARYHLNDRGIAYPIVSEWLGHARVTTTLEFYAGVNGGLYAHMMN